MPKPKKITKQAHKPRWLSLIAQEASESQTHTNVRKTGPIHNEVGDTVSTSYPMVSEASPSEPLWRVSSLITTFVPLTDDFFQVPTPPSSLITRSIPITSIPPIPPTTFVGVSLPQIYVSLSTPFFTDSTATTTMIAMSTPEVTANVFDMGVGVTFGATVGPSTSTTLPLREDDPDLLFGDDQDDFQNFVFCPITIHQVMDDEDAPMTIGQFKQLNAKLDSLLESSNATSNYKFMLKSCRATVE